MIRVSSGSAVISLANRDCSAWLYTTTGGQPLGEVSEPTPAQAVNKSVATPRAARGRVQHLAVNGICALQIVQPFRGAACALTRPAKVEKKEGDGERSEGKTYRLPRPWPGEKPGQQGAPHQRRPLRQSSTRAHTATAIPPSASAMNTQRSVSR